MNSSQHDMKKTPKLWEVILKKIGLSLFAPKANASFCQSHFIIGFEVLMGKLDFILEKGEHQKNSSPYLWSNFLSYSLS